MAVAKSLELHLAVAKALGLEGRCVERVVIDIPVRGVVRVYVQEFMHKDSVDGVVAALAEHRDQVEVKVVDSVSVAEGQCGPQVVAGSPEFDDYRSLFFHVYRQRGWSEADIERRWQENQRAEAQRAAATVHVQFGDESTWMTQEEYAAHLSPEMMRCACGRTVLRPCVPSAILVCDCGRQRELVNGEVVES